MVKYQSFCQIVTTNTKDTIICLPKKWVEGMIKDIQDNDKNKIKIGQLRDSIDYQNKTIGLQDTLIDALMKKIKFYKSSAEDDRAIRLQNYDSIKYIDKKNKNYRFQRNFFILLGIITTTLIIIK